ncbi:hypothetical protein BO78DRAFT_400326 [Aspergillus sclerotiicarbonarius CBS 121057]|uniref:Uncharacterized protein n=1 Tax=Aspergillus sclerotiicarbonarius (strain CBS 121057 / IBT 28362) TaxID=1448318 RepID=A0A319DYF1_ASPSB|nr:hypothetical protein BO78DRAFT_400326 [Aspergillus sclerotiicarbonarius CBS 121057]
MLTLAVVALVLYLAHLSGQRHDAAAVPPPQFDPDSYQYRLVAAMHQHGLRYKDIVPTPVEELSQERKKHKNLDEMFTSTDW